MRLKKPLGMAAVAALTCTAALVAAPASAEAPKAKEVLAKVTVITRGLDGPREVSSSGRSLYVAESDSGEITRVNKTTGAQRVEVKNVFTPQGVVKTGGRIYIASGTAEPDADPPQDPGIGSKLLVAKPGKKAKTFANLLAYELKYNPDNQTQFGPDGKPLDSVSNPFYVAKDKWPGGFLLVADGGANDVLKVSKKGHVSTFFVPPSVTTGDCATQKQNSDAGPSCDAVPTGLAFGPDGNLYISALTSEVAGQGRVYVVNRYGKLLRTLTGFSAPTGVAVAPGGTIYVSELLQGAPEGPPPAGFDPAEVGQIVRVAKDGTRTYAQVTMPSGLLWNDGKLYASAWSVASFLNIPKAGQIVSVDLSSFVK